MDAFAANASKDVPKSLPLEDSMAHLRNDSEFRNLVILKLKKSNWIEWVCFQPNIRAV